MPFISMRRKLQLTQDEISYLEWIGHSRTHPLREVERAKILLCSIEGKNDSQIARELHTNRHKVMRCIEKALAYGLEESLKDFPRSGHPREISFAARSWLISIACVKPRDLGYSRDMWTQRLLASYIREHCKENGFEELSNLSQGTISKILNSGTIKSHEIASYVQQQDLDFGSKSAVVLYIYKQVEIITGEISPCKEILSAIITNDHDLSRKPGANPTISPDCEDVRLGPLSLLAGVDLLTGKIYHKVFEKHGSEEFIQFLKYLNEHFPSGIEITIILDNVKEYKSKNATEYSSGMPNRFRFVFIPKHVSWINIIKGFFGNMVRSMLLGIHVSSSRELSDRIDEYFYNII